MFKKTLGCLVVVGWMLGAPNMAMAAPETHPAGDWTCPCPGGEKPMGGASSCDEVCYGSSRSSTPSRDYEAERRAQEQAEAERRAEAERQAELERQRKAEEERRRQEEADRQAKFIRDRDDAAGSLRGSTGMNITPNTSGGTVLRGSTPLKAEPGLKDALKDTGLRGTQPAKNAAKSEQQKAWQQVHCAAFIAQYALAALQTKGDYDEFSTLSVQAFKALDGQQPNVECGTAPAFPNMNGKTVDMDRVISTERQVLERATKIAERMKQRGDKPGSMQPTMTKPPANETQIEKVRREQRELNVINTAKNTGKTQQEINQQEKDRKELANLVIRNNDLESGKLVDRSYKGLE